MWNNFASCDISEVHPKVQICLMPPQLFTDFREQMTTYMTYKRSGLVDIISIKITCTQGFFPHNIFWLQISPTWVPLGVGEGRWPSTGLVFHLPNLPINKSHHMQFYPSPTCTTSHAKNLRPTDLRQERDLAKVTLDLLWNLRFFA